MIRGPSCILDHEDISTLLIICFFPLFLCFLEFDWAFFPMLFKLYQSFVLVSFLLYILQRLFWVDWFILLFLGADSSLLILFELVDYNWLEESGIWFCSVRVGRLKSFDLLSLFFFFLIFTICYSNRECLGQLVFLIFGP